MDVDGERIRRDAGGTGGDEGRARACAGRAEGVVGDGSAGVAVPGAGAETSGSGDYVDEAHVGGTVDDVGRSNAGALAILAGGCVQAADFALVERHPGEARLKVERLQLADDEARVGSVAVNHCGALAAAGKRNAEGNSEKQEYSERYETAHSIFDLRFRASGEEAGER